MEIQCGGIWPESIMFVRNRWMNTRSKENLVMLLRAIGGLERVPEQLLPDEIEMITARISDEFILEKRFNIYFATPLTLRLLWDII